MEFENNFKTLTGFSPLSWQVRLYSDYFRKGALPAAVDVPTGLGKTAVMALWLIGRAQGATLPRRLVYVVDRRAVVDQATDFAATLRTNLNKLQVAHLKSALGLGDRSLPISTLRGQHVDNREWLEDPASVAIIVGTVDMIGSRLLFEGYGVSRKMRPYHAGLLGADTLVVLDEAHLVPPFEKLLETIENDSKQFGAHDQNNGPLIPAFKLLSLSATGRQRAGNVFDLKGSFDAPAGQRQDLDDEVVAQRLKARKSITLVRTESEKLEEGLAAQAWQLAERGRAPIRCIVFSNGRDTAEKAKKEIEGLAKGDQKQGRATIGIDTELFVGARRVRERVAAAERLRGMGFIAGGSVQQTQPTFLFATSAGEVGVDLDADHMVCDLVAWERMVQRLGRVNRRGERDARVIIVDGGVPRPKKDSAPTSEEAEAIQRHKALHDLLKALPKQDDGANSLAGSPDALRTLRERAKADPEIARIIKAATTIEPLRPALSRALVDAWSMTSLEEHTGRPEVSPWLRGWVEESPQTTVVWRKHLPLRHDGAVATVKEIEAFFEAAPPHASERLETETFRVRNWLRDRCDVLLKSVRFANVSNGANEEQSDGEPRASDETAEEGIVASAPLRRNSTMAFVLSQSGGLRQTLHLKDFLDLEDKAKANRLDRELEKLAGAVIVMDARFGGLKDGLLDSDCPDAAEAADDGHVWLPLAPASGSGGRSEPVVKFRLRSISASEIDDAGPNWLERYRFSTERNVEGADLRWLIIDKWRGDSANENDRSASIHPQLLSEHQSWAEAKARALAEKLALSVDWVEALAVAARLHDEGKKASRWQRAFNAPAGSEPYAKTRGPISFARLDEYRHEFGSLPWAEKDESFRALPEEIKDLVLHLIAAHHGQARPVIGARGCEDAPPSLLEDRARQVALRFARLQKRWGPWGLAWWEALLRAADQQASRANDDRAGEKT